MKKRLRKKKHEGEFQEFGFEVSFGLLADLAFEERNAVLDAFITEAIEANGLQFGGGGTTTWEGFIALDKPRGSATEDHRSVVTAWLEKNPKIVNVQVGELRDAWHGWDS